MTDPHDENKEKFEAFNRLLDGDHVMAHINPKDDDVIIPANLKKSETVTLKLSRLFRGGIELTPDKIQTNLLFGSNYFACTIPLTAIWGVTSSTGSNIVWPKSAPADILNKLIKNQVERPEPEESSGEEKKPPKLRRIK